MAIERIPSPSEDSHSSGQPAGIALIAGSIVMLVFLAMHPTAHAHAGADRAAEISEIAGRNAIVHGTLIANQALILLGLLGLADRLGMRRLAVRAGVIAFAMGTIGIMGAALINGFAVPAMIAGDASSDASDPAVNAVISLAHHAAMALIYMGISAVCAAVLAWSAVLLRRGGPGSALGWLGMVCGALPVLGLVSGHMHVDLHGMIGFAALQAIWYVAIAVQLIRGRI